MLSPDVGEARGARGGRAAPGGRRGRAASLSCCQPDGRPDIKRAPDVLPLVAAALSAAAWNATVVNCLI